MIREKILAHQKHMLARLEEIRASFEHSGNRGSSLEASVRSFLRQYLPARYRIGHGEIIDQDRRISSQMDVVAANEEHPYIFEEGELALFFIEGVSAVGEVKTQLTSQGLQDTIEKCICFRSLQTRICVDFILLLHSFYWLSSCQYPLEKFVKL